VTAPPVKRRPAVPLVDPARCTGCGWCVAACPDHLLELHTQAGRKSSVLPPAQRERCTGCVQCIPVCHFGAIRMKRLDGGAAA